MQTNRHYRILVVEDDRTLNTLICLSLQRAGHRTISASNGLDALNALKTDALDIVLLDVMMPGMDGFQICAEIRMRYDIPVVMLTALNQTDSIVRGLSMGADDYVTKPFVTHELLARIEAVMRRTRGAHSPNQFAPLLSTGPVLLLGDVTINLANEDHGAIVRGETVVLTYLEFLLLRYLMTHAGESVTKAQLLVEVWGYPANGDTNIVEVCMFRLRKKIELDSTNPTHLVTIRGYGYKFALPLVPTQGINVLPED